MILVTGHRGMIGSRLMKKLGTWAIGIDVKEGKNLLTCELPENIDTIYHLAAQTSVEASWSDPLHDLDNIRITARIVHHYSNARIVYANSAASINPSSPYGFSKKIAGDYVKTFHKDWVSCVFPNIYGERGGKSVVDIFKDNEVVNIFGDGKQIRDYVHVDDIVDALVKAIHWPVGEYFMGSGISTTVLQLAEGKEVVFKEARKEARESILQNTTPNWEPKINVHEYLSS